MPREEVHSSALNQLKQALSEATNRRLYVADLNKPYNIKVDASDKTVAGYLSQAGDDNVEYPLAFFSAKLSGTVVTKNLGPLFTKRLMQSSLL